MVDRDRDPAGRARNARPRDASGRPLPYDSAGVEGVPDDLALGPNETLEKAQSLLDEGRPFHAHEVLEGTWKAAPGHERDLWQGLAQLAVGLTHAQRGNANGSVALLHRGAERIEPYAGDPPYGIRARGLISSATELAGRIERDGFSGLGDGMLTLRLAGGPEEPGRE